MTEPPTSAIVSLPFKGEGQGGDGGCVRNSTLRCPHPLLASPLKGKERIVEQL